MGKILPGGVKHCSMIILNKTEISFSSHSLKNLSFWDPQMWELLSGIMDSLSLLQVGARGSQTL